VTWCNTTPNTQPLRTRFMKYATQAERTPLSTRSTTSALKQKQQHISRRVTLKLTHTHERVRGHDAPRNIVDVRLGARLVASIHAHKHRRRCVEQQRLRRRKAAPRVMPHESKSASQQR
jgi:hypothetical protein